MRSDSVERFKFSVSEFNKAMGIKGKKTYSYLKSYCKNLIKSDVEIASDKENKFLYVSWFEFIESKDGWVEICPTRKLKEFLIVDKNFISYDIKNVMNLKSYYSIRIYELIKQYERLGKRECTIEKLRAMLGIEEDKYPRFSNFKMKVLNVAKKEIMEKTDLKFTFDEMRAGRQVYKIKFFILPNIKLSDEEKLINSFKNATGQLLHPDRLKELINKKGIDKVRFYINNFYKFMQYSNVKEPVRLFYKAVINEYSLPKEQPKFNKPEQSRNFDQREYDDEFFESLYDNFNV
jgi:plasmid replication initiation protein